MQLHSLAFNSFHTRQSLNEVTLDFELASACSLNCERISGADIVVNPIKIGTTAKAHNVKDTL